MKRIAIFVDNLNVGGIQKSIINMLKNLNKKNYELDLYVFSKEHFYEVPEGINVITLKRPNKFLKFIPFNIVRRIYNPTIQKEYDVSVDFDSYQMHTAIGALNCKAKKRVIWVHNDIPIKLKEEFKYRILHFFFKNKYKHFDEYVAVSQGAIDSFKTIENHRNKIYTVIPNYIDTNEIKIKMEEKSDIKVDNDKVNIVSVGRLCHQKGYDLMLENINELKENRTDFHLYLIGDGPDKAKLEKLCEIYKIQNFVTFLGNQKNPFKYLKQMDLFYLTSRYEGQGMVLLEAKAVGLDVLIPEHLEKYCPEIKSKKNVLKELKKYRSEKIDKKFDDLKTYNNSITESLDKLFNI